MLFGRKEKRLVSHRELWEYSKVVAKELGKWILNAWNNASGMHICFYEGWCTREHVESALESIANLVSVLARRILGGN